MSETNMNAIPDAVQVSRNDELHLVLADTELRLASTKESLLRVSADFDNFRRRAVKDREDATKFANENLLKDLLPVVDGLDRACMSGGDAQALADGVRLVSKQFTDVLAKHGVQSFVSTGTPFDPNRHEALVQVASPVTEGTVVNEVTKGYTLNDRLVRPAQVVVSKGIG